MLDASPMIGYTTRITPRGYCVIELDYLADPSKRAPDFERRARAAVTSDKEFRREYKRDWTTSAGEPFYPEFAQIGRGRYQLAAAGLVGTGAVYRGFDLGYRAPVCVWFQYSDASDRVWVLREFVPKQIATEHFADAVLYLSGQRPYEGLPPIAKEWVDAYAQTAGMPAPPWFAPGTVFLDYSGPEANRTEAIAARDPAEANTSRVFAAKGILLGTQAGPIRARTDVLRRLLALRSDGWPGLLVDPACPEVLAMLDGGLAYKRPSRNNPKPDHPQKDGHFDNVNDALTYGLAAVVPSVERAVPIMPLPAAANGQLMDPYEGFELYETRRRRR